MANEQSSRQAAGAGDIIAPAESLAAAVRRKVAEELGGERRRMTLNFGPQHPSTHGVLRVLLTVEGETVVEALPDIGYLHRNWEYIVERWNYPMVIPFSDRNDYLAAIANEQAVTSAIESLLGVEVPERALYIRMLALELQRITSHLIALGTFALDMGMETVFLYCFNQREMCYSLFEKLTGARLLYNYFRIGGVRNDLPSGWLDELTRFLDQFEKPFWPELGALLFGNEIFVRRTKNVGIIPPETAIAFGASGPVLRGSGINWDLRKHDKIGTLPYDKVDFEVQVGENGDAYDRALIRYNEMIESAKIIRQIIDMLPDGKVMGNAPRTIRPEPGESFSRVESPRGEIGVHVISDGKPSPYRIKWRAPSFVHLQLLPEMAKGHLIADLVVCIGSLDIVLGEVDR